MKIIEIAHLENGAHRNQSGGALAVPSGWAVIPPGMSCPNFPFGEVEAAEVDGIMTVTKWMALPIPEPEPEEPETDTEPSVWDELDAAYTAGYQEGVDSV